LQTAGIVLLCRQRRDSLPASVRTTSRTNYRLALQEHRPVWLRWVRHGRPVEKEQWSSWPDLRDVDIHSPALTCRREWMYWRANANGDLWACHDRCDDRCACPKDKMRSTANVASSVLC